MADPIMFDVTGEQGISDIHPKRISHNRCSECMRFAHQAKSPSRFWRKKVSYKRSRQRSRRMRGRFLLFCLPSQGLSESKYGLTSSNILSICCKLKKLRTITPPAILRALTISSTVARELSNSFTLGNGDLDDLTGLWSKLFWLVSDSFMKFASDMVEYR